MNIVFRVDSSVDIGSGHLMRCLALAEFLIEQSVKVNFICRALNGNLIDVLKKKNINLTVLSSYQASAKLNENILLAIGVSQEKDASDTINALGGAKPDWIIVDHYSLDIKWEKMIRPFVKKIFVIDDLANRPHDCDVLLDQNYYQNLNRRYTKLVPLVTKLLLGSQIICNELTAFVFSHAPEVNIKAPVAKPPRPLTVVFLLV